MSGINSQCVDLNCDDLRMIENMFCAAWPDLVRQTPASELKAATEMTVAALVAGVTALRQLSGSTL